MATSDLEDYLNDGGAQTGAEHKGLVTPEPEAKEEPKAEPEAQDDPEEPELPLETSEEGEADESSDEPSDEGEQEEKPKKSNKDFQIERLKREKAEAQRERAELLARLENLEKGLQNSQPNVTPVDSDPEPDPLNSDLYPLGHLDAAYHEDKMAWLVRQQVAQAQASDLQRQQENAQNQKAFEEQKVLLEKVDNLAVRGNDLAEDFQTKVVEAGMRGDWELTQVTFEAAHEAENGAQILYNLASDKAEAARVARLTPFQQLQYVAEKDAELKAQKTPRRIPRAGEPLQNTSRGRNSRVIADPSTDDWDEFERAIKQDAKSR